MLGVLAFLTGWAMLLPAVLLLYLQSGGAYGLWMAPFLGLAESAPMFAFSTIGGLAMLALSARQFLRREP